MSPRTKRFFGILGASVALLLIFVRWYGQLNTPAARGTTTSNSVADEMLFAPDFTLPTLKDGVISLSQFRGKKAVVLDFWASWCHNCQRDMPNLNRFYNQYKDRVEVIGVNLGESQQAVAAFADAYGISFPLALDSSGQVSTLYGIQYTNTHFLINKEGRAVGAIPGDISENDFERLLK